VTGYCDRRHRHDRIPDHQDVPWKYTTRQRRAGRLALAGAKVGPSGLDGHAVATGQERQAVAARLGFSETVFVDDAGTGAVDIYTPSVRLPFAGHPLVGTSWLLRRLGTGPELPRPQAGPGAPGRRASSPGSRAARSG
jgi:hypothetical protein